MSNIYIYMSKYQTWSSLHNGFCIPLYTLAFGFRCCALGIDAEFLPNVLACLLYCSTGVWELAVKVSQYDTVAYEGYSLIMFLWLSPGPL